MSKEEKKLLGFGGEVTGKHPWAVQMPNPMGEREFMRELLNEPLQVNTNDPALLAALEYERDCTIIEKNYPEHLQYQAPTPSPVRYAAAYGTTYLEMKKHWREVERIQSDPNWEMDYQLLNIKNVTPVYFAGMDFAGEGKDATAIVVGKYLGDGKVEILKVKTNETTNNVQDNDN